MERHRDPEVLLHLGSVSLVTDGQGNVVSQARYTPYGELRWPAVSQSPTDFGYTGQRAEGFGLMDYNARFYSPHLGRFVSADTVVPNPGKAIDFDRFAYSANNPIRYRDPSGHGYCNSQYADPAVCDEIDPDGDGYTDPFHVDPDDYEAAVEAGYEDSLERALDFIDKLRRHQGWWSEYINSGDFETAWKFLLVLAFATEAYSYYGYNDWDTFKDFMTDSIINKVGDLYQSYGTAGLLAYLGGREALFKARNHPDEDPRWIEGTPEYMNTWGFAPDDPNPYLAKTATTFEEAISEIDKAWPLIVSYDGTLYGSGAYDYGVAPPMNMDPDKVVWVSADINGINPWTNEDGIYNLFFITK